MMGGGGGGGGGVISERKHILYTDLRKKNSCKGILGEKIFQEL